MAVASIISLRVPPFPLFQSSSECMLNVDKSVFRCNFIDKIWKRTEFDGQNLFSVSRVILLIKKLAQRTNSERMQYNSNKLFAKKSVSMFDMSILSLKIDQGVK
jgi:hypothetical protein